MADGLVKEVSTIFNECIEILKAKNKDYSGEADSFGNFRMCEMLGICRTECGILVRITDKLARTANLLDKEPAVRDERIDDTLKDLINYSAILLAYLRSRRSNSIIDSYREGIVTDEVKKLLDTADNVEDDLDTSNTVLEDTQKPKLRGRPPKYLPVKKTKEQQNQEQRHRIRKNDNINWIQHGSFQYAVHDGRLLMSFLNKEGKRTWSRNFDYEKIKQLYEQLPEESYAEDVARVAKELGLNIDSKITTRLMKIFANYVDFDAELVKEPGKTKPKSKLIKHNFSLADENRKQLEIEKSTIGTPYAVGD